MYTFTYAMHNRPHETHTVYAIRITARDHMMTALRLSGYVVKVGDNEPVNPWEQTTLDTLWFHLDKKDNVLAAVAHEEESDELHSGLMLMMSSTLGIRKVVHRPYATEGEVY